MNVEFNKSLSILSLTMTIVLSHSGSNPDAFRMILYVERATNREVKSRAFDWKRSTVGQITFYLRIVPIEFFIFPYFRQVIQILSSQMHWRKFGSIIYLSINHLFFWFETSVQQLLWRNASTKRQVRRLLNG